MVDRTSNILELTGCIHQLSLASNLRKNQSNATIQRCKRFTAREKNYAHVVSSRQEENTASYDLKMPVKVNGLLI
jgi:hypothetical protein